MTRWAMALPLCIAVSACGPATTVPSAAEGGDSTGNPPRGVSGGAPDNEAAPLSYAQRRGKRLFLHYCAVCHGETGAGDGFNAYNLAPTRPRDLSQRAFSAAVSDHLLAEVIREGGRGTRRSVLMPAWGHTLDEGQVEDLVAYLRALAR